MEKNVAVLDKNGVQIGVTYPKRARGLVKKGRARYVDAYSICLACPPNDDLEDNQMNKNTVDIPEAVSKETEAILPDAQPENEAPAGKSKYSIDYILEQIEQIGNDKGYLYEAIEKAESSPTNDLALHLGMMVEQREQTNRKLIEFYQQMYADLVKKPEPVMTLEQVRNEYWHDIAEKLVEEIKTTEDNQTKKALSAALSALFH